MTDADDILIYFGIKGMKWGVRKEDELVGIRPRKGDDKAQVRRFNEASKRVREQIKQQKVNGVDIQSEALKAKYGPPAEEKKGMPKAAKIAICVGIGVAVVGIIGAVAYQNMGPSTKEMIQKAAEDAKRHADIERELKDGLAANPSGSSP